MKAVEKLLLLTQPETGVQPTPGEGAARLKEALTWAACEGTRPHALARTGVVS